MKRYAKVIINIILILVLSCSSHIEAFAESAPNAGSSGKAESATAESATAGKIVDDANSFLDKGKESESPINGQALKDGSNIIYNVLLILGIAVALIWGLVLGIQFITGTIEEKAEIKKGLIPYVVGCIIIFGAFGIWKLVLNLLAPLS
ncbi:MAG: pilin [Clostridia bacterium]